MSLMRTQTLRKAAFAFLPNAVVADPPIGKGLLSDFEFRVLWAVLAHSRLCKGRRATCGALLSLMQASDHRNNADKLEDALTRLHYPIGTWPPLVRAINACVIEVDPFWQPSGNFAPVAVPPRTGVSLWLFAARINKGSEASARLKWKPLRSLAALLGITDHPRRSLQRMVAAVNRHLERIDHEVLASHGVKLPLAFGIAINSDKVTITSDWGEADDDREGLPISKPKRKPKLTARQEYIERARAAQEREYELELDEREAEYQLRLRSEEWGVIHDPLAD